MNWDRLTRVTPPAEMPLSVAAARANLRVDTVEEDEEISSLIAAAVAAVDGPNGVGICLVTQTWRLTLDAFPAAIPLPLGPVQSVASITYLDASGAEVTLAGAGYVLDAARYPAIIEPAPGSAWPLTSTQPGAVRVNFVAGFGSASDIPGDLVQALKLVVASHYDGDGMIPPAATSIFNRYR